MSSDDPEQPLPDDLPVRLELTRPDDWHVHIRDGELLTRVAPFTARHFGRAIVMPNLNPPITTTAAASAYADRIRAALPEGVEFEPLMTLYLTDTTTPDEIRRAADSAHVHAVKLYPKGATTNSAHGVASLDKLAPVLEAMEAADLPLLVHGEITNPECDVFDREHRFQEDVLAPLVARHEGLRVVFEHITTAEAAAYVAASPARIGATITPQHLLFNRNALFAGGLRPHRYCIPVLKRERDRAALVEAATSGNPSFFLGTDSAPHTRDTKETECGCAGIFSAPNALAAYAEAFARAGAIDRLEGFASHHGADWYGLPRNTARITLERTDRSAPAWLGDRTDAAAIAVFGEGRRFAYHVVD